MGRPSIFSSKYERQMKRRRNIKIFLVVIVVFIIIIVVAANLNIFNLSNISKDGKVSSVASEKKDTKPSKSKKTNKSEANSSDNNKTSSQSENSSFIVTMPDNKAVKVYYSNNGGTKKISNVDVGVPDISYNISPSGSEVVVYEKSTQNMMLAKSDGTSSNITKTSYVSGSNTTFDEATTLKNDPSYIWCASPEFIDDDNIAFISQLPWFITSKPDKYIWIYNLKNNSYTNTNINGLDTTLGSLTPKGLSVTLNNNTQYLKSDGTLSN